MVRGIFLTVGCHCCYFLGIVGVTELAIAIARFVGIFLTGVAIVESGRTIVLLVQISDFLLEIVNIVRIVECMLLIVAVTFYDYHLSMFLSYVWWL